MFAVIQVGDPEAFEQCEHAEAKIHPVPKVNPQELAWRVNERVAVCHLPNLSTYASLTAFRNAFAHDGHQQQNGQEHRGPEANALARHGNVQPEGAKRKHGDDGARKLNCKEIWVLKTQQFR